MGERVDDQGSYVPGIIGNLPLLLEQDDHQCEYCGFVYKIK